MKIPTMFIIAALSLALLVVPWKFAFVHNANIQVERPASYALVFFPPKVTEAFVADAHVKEANLWSVQLDAARYCVQVVVALLVGGAVLLALRRQT